MKKKTARLAYKATTRFDKKIAKSLMNLDYYKAQSANQKNYVHIEKEKLRLSTPRWTKVTDLITNYKLLGYTEKSSSGRAFLGIYKKNKTIALGAPFQKTTNILSIIARTETLLLAYKKIKGNRGALTKGAVVDPIKLQSYSPQQRELYYKSQIFPDGFSIRDLDIVSFLLLKGKYPWGTSKRIWVDKPGNPLKKRPITIPPFMDRVVQEAIKMALYAIWEPDFEKLNRSFGFRPRKTCHDAIAAISSSATTGYFRAIEGDTQEAYDRVEKNIMIAKLQKKIKDNKFIQLIKERLNYDYIDGSTRTKPVLGIPQGGIDSPYLYNIYNHDLDLFVCRDLKGYLHSLNIKKKTVKKALPTKIRKKMIYQKNAHPLPYSQMTKLTLRGSQPRKEQSTHLYFLHKNIRDIRLLQHRIRKIPYYDPNRRTLDLFYVRYADDWIILTNTDQLIAQKLKDKIREFMLTDMGATLSEEKTLITDLRKDKAHFLGFEVSRTPKGRLMYIDGKLTRAPGMPIIIGPDRQRMINKFFTKGFCKENGFPIAVPWLANLEDHIIIERFNASIRGVMQYHGEWVTNISTLNRWIYILRYSCLKTFANKYKSTISKVFKRFGKDLFSSSTKTIGAEVNITIGDVIYVKEWKLLTILSIRNSILAQKRKEKLTKIFWEREKGKIGGYHTNSPNPSITQDNYLDAISWVSLRTQASFHMPCILCRATKNIEMHHIKSIRKSSYTNLEAITFLQMMSLRNRKQIPVCHECHRDKIHGGKYSGPALRTLLSKKLVDNRILHIESYVKPGQEYYVKSLSEKGWAIKQYKLLKGEAYDTDFYDSNSEESD